MLLTDARRPARTGPDGELIPDGRAGSKPLDSRRHRRGSCSDQCCASSGPYQLQAAIAAVHDEAPSAAETDWPQILALYEILLRRADNPVVALNHAVAVAMVRGAPTGLALLAELESDQRIAGDHRLHAVRAHLLEMTGDRSAAHDSYLIAARLTASFQQQRYLHGRAAGAAAARPADEPLLCSRLRDL